MIECINVSKHVSKGTQKTFILQNINVKIEEGEFVSVMGPSGSGKSTILHILGLLEDATCGIYRLQGEEVQSLNEKKKIDLDKRV